MMHFAFVYLVITLSFTKHFLFDQMKGTNGTGLYEMLMVMVSSFKNTRFKSAFWLCMWRDGIKI